METNHMAKLQNIPNITFTPAFFQFWGTTWLSTVSSTPGKSKKS